jgi:sensor histidine kinase regulating citrate/malate metabolism
MATRRMTLAGQLLALQLLIVLAVLVVVGAIGVAQSTEEFQRVEGREALAAAENLAAQRVVRQQLARTDPSGQSLAAAGERNRSVSGASFVAIGDDDAIVLASSDPTLQGDRLPVGESDVLSGGSWRGVMTVTGRRMTMALVPVYEEEGGEQVGLVAIGRDIPTTVQLLRRAVPNLLAYVGVASALGIAGSFLLSRRIKRQTLGLEPTEIAGLVEHREAMLHGIKEGVIALDTEQRITLVNDGALELLRLPADCVGQRLEAQELEEQVKAVLTHDQPGPDRLVLAGDRVLALNRMPMRSLGRVIGSVTTLRDRTELTSLEKELGTTRATTDTLRAQTHEFANQLHTIAGLLQLEEYDEVLHYVDRVREDRTKLHDQVTARIQDPTVAALLIAKASLAAERGVALEVDDESRLGRVDDDLSRDLTTVVGNLVDNALDATTSCADGRVRVRVLEKDGSVDVRVQDSGRGVPAVDADLVFTQGYSTKVDAAGDGRGFGLALTRLVCRRRGGDVRVHNDGGAVFTATLPVEPGAGRVLR